MSCRKWQIQIFRWQEGQLDRESEAALLRHIEACGSCRDAADEFSELDRLFLETPEPSTPPFLKERIVARVIEEMREDSAMGSLRGLFGSLASFRPAVAGIILALGVTLGVFTGLSISQSLNTNSTASSYDLLALSGIQDQGNNSSLDFIWTDTNGGRR